MVRLLVRLRNLLFLYSNKLQIANNNGKWQSFNFRIDFAATFSFSTSTLINL